MTLWPGTSTFFEISVRLPPFAEKPQLPLDNVIIGHVPVPVGLGTKSLRKCLARYYQMRRNQFSTVSSRDFSSLLIKSRRILPLLNSLSGIRP
jgi:hypothetical protein